MGKLCTKRLHFQLDVGLSVDVTEPRFCKFCGTLLIILFLAIATNRAPTSHQVLDLTARFQHSLSLLDLLIENQLSLYVLET